ncbi:MAG: GAP family protein [Micromonosporaceae bacterium]
MQLDVLPLAITMMAGPQIMAAIVFVTAEQPVRVSLAFLAGVLAATLVGLTLARLVAAVLGGVASFGDAGDRGSLGTVIQLVLVGLLVVLALRSYLGRRTATAPSWLGNLLSAGPGRALAIGFLVILLMPSDVVVMLTVGANLEQHDADLTAALPLVAATSVIAALPLLTYLLFRGRAARMMPLVRDWMNTHSWLINILVCLLFIVLILF